MFMVDIHFNVAHYHVMTSNEIIGPSGVRALPVAAGTNVVAPIVGIIFLLLLLLSSEALTFLLERRQLGFWNFTWAFISQKSEDSIEKNISGTPLPPKKGSFLVDKMQKNKNNTRRLLWGS
jgi:hypothetical protein